MSRRFLSIDASTYTGSCAIVTDAGEVLSERTAAMRGEKEERLMPAVAALFDSVPARTGITGIICGEGPGSFTSLRIAASIAKGLSHGLGLPVYPVSSLLLMVASVPALTPGRYVALLDAMREELYCLKCVVRDGGAIAADGEMTISNRAEVDRLLDDKQRGITAIGEGRTIAALPHARGAGRLIADIVAAGPVDASEWEPNYGRMPEAEVRLRVAGSAARSG